MPSAAELVLVGTNHTRAPLAVRERLAAHDHGRELLHHLTASAAVAEAVGLSTCNRCELYMVGADADAMREAAVDGLGHLSGHAAERLEPMLYVHRGELAARHLFGVAGGLDSMVPGEAQILAQIREAYESAYEWDATGPVTNRLFHQALEAGKRVRHETAIGRGRRLAGLRRRRPRRGAHGRTDWRTHGCWSWAPAEWPSSSPQTSPPAASRRSPSPTATPTGPLRWRRGSAAAPSTSPTCGRRSQLPTSSSPRRPRRSP